ncbi:uncharacterized protein V1510DRAFT_363746 [Dipodascopsis tothii]|uniref:uncharacterized protein n=1 Tax=Dipodascopsis tothii TaxID=44089 RepID=UPI0034CD589D
MSEHIDTDTKIALLASLINNSDISPEILLEFLLNADGDVEKAYDDARATLSETEDIVALPRSRKRHLQVAVTDYIQQPKRKQLPADKPIQELHADSDNLVTKRSPQSTRVVHLYTAETIAEHTPCTFYSNFLSEELANNLLTELLNDSIEWRQNHFRLFDRQVTSAHHSAFYVHPESYEKFQGTYYYNGAPIEDIKKFGGSMITAKKLVESTVNSDIISRGYKRYQCKEKWKADCAVCNRYTGPNESVGWHSDRLTYIGPMPVIASLSLGVTREFRVRETGIHSTTYSIHLPHNSLLVMHPPCQEKYKHTIIPLRSVDVHEVAGTARINITYRMYRPEFSAKKIPLCSCEVPMILRCVSRQERSVGQYYWSCSAKYQKDKGCSDFHWASFSEDGIPT